jgi:hypothetical protein
MEIKPRMTGVGKNKVFTFCNMFKNVLFFDNFDGEERCRDILAVQIMQNLK